MKLRKQEQEFRNPKVFYPDPKNVDLDRVLINLFLLLRCDGTRPATKGRLTASIEKVEHHVEQLAQILPGDPLAEGSELVGGRTSCATQPTTL